MTLNAKDIEKINRLYVELERLHMERKRIRDANFDELNFRLRIGTSGVGYLSVGGLTDDAMSEVRDVVARDIRRRAAKTVDALHKLGCEAKLTED